MASELLLKDRNSKITLFLTETLLFAGLHINTHKTPAYLGSAVIKN